MNVPLDYWSVMVCEDIAINVMSHLDGPSIAHLACCSRRSMIFGRTLSKQLWRVHYSAAWAALRSLRTMRGIEWDPSDCTEGLQREPTQGWSNFLQDFDLMWIDWVLAGLNTETCCAVGIEGCIMEISHFLTRHPGSQETLLFAAGGDVTTFFNDVGHSYDARQISKEFMVAKGPAPPTLSGRRRVFSTRQRRLLKDKQEAVQMGLNLWDST